MSSMERRRQTWINPLNTMYLQMPTLQTTMSAFKESQRISEAKAREIDNFCVTSYICRSLIITLRIIPCGAATCPKCSAVYGENPTYTCIFTLNTACKITTCQVLALFIEWKEHFQLFKCCLLHSRVTFPHWDTPSRNSPVLSEHNICAACGLFGK